jgi:spore maturation protein CgeB
MARIVVLGLSLSSSWGNGHATTYRALLKALARRGHEVLFLERDVPWYAAHRDLPNPEWCRLAFYDDLEDLQRFVSDVREADAVIVGSFVPEGIAAGDWVLATANGRVAFYDIDTPETLKALERGSCEYIDRDLIARYPVYLSFTGGPMLDRLRALGSRFPAPLYCAVDPETHKPVATATRWTLGYLGTHSDDRQDPLETLLFEPARAMENAHFVVAGAQYPGTIAWPENVEHIDHLPPDAHPAFYSAQAFTLNITRAAMRNLGWSPSVRLFEAAACGVPIISDFWTGLDNFFKPDEEILITERAEDVVSILTNPLRRGRIAVAARKAVLCRHTADIRAVELERLLQADGESSRGYHSYALSV